jgi:hypothetical protein
VEFDMTDFLKYASGLDDIASMTEQEARHQVEFTVTACHAMRGSGSSEINGME